MRQELLLLYQSQQHKFREIVDQFPNEKLYGPYLVSPSNKYIEQKNRLLIIGQETNGWSEYVENLDKQMQCYEEFNVGETYKSTPFWNVTRKVEKIINHEQFSCVGANINKFDVDQRRPKGKHETAISTLDNILVSEISILKPKICIFFTSHTFDYRLKEIFSEVELLKVDGFTTKELCQLKHPNLPELSFRTYHPKFLRINRKEGKFLAFISTLSI